MSLMGSSRNWHSWEKNLVIREMATEMSKIERHTGKKKDEKDGTEYPGTVGHL